MIVFSDITGIDEGLARRIIAVARSIAPCLGSLTDDPRADAIAILQGVAVEIRTRGSRSVKSQRVGPAAVEYTDVASWFSDDDRNALRALCDAATAGSGRDPIGQFPLPARVISRMWPEEQC